ncbi:MAG: YheV family putative zinc ribbon protein [Halieaceae bacterium]
MTRRFIAGAVCPRCGKMDKLLIDSEADLRECVSCGYRDQRPGDTPSELKTRVNRAAARRVETDAEPVTLIKPPATDSES